MQGLKKVISRILLCTMVVMQTLATTGVTTVHAASSLTELESVMVSGGSFDTGIAINQDYSIEISFSLSSLGQYKNLYESSPYILRNEATKGLYARHGWYNTKVYTPQVDENITVLQKKNITYINDKQVLKATYQSITPSTTLKFGDFKGSIKGFRVWNASNVLVGDYVPALDSSNKACMYDKVKKQYIYYTGSCVAGKTIISNEIEESTETEEVLGTEDTVLEEENSIIVPNIEYVDALVLSGGTFDSGIKLNQDYSIEIAFSLSALNQYKNLFSSNVYTLRNEATNGLYLRHGWYNGKIYLPKEDEDIILQQKKNITYINDKQVLKETRQTIEDTSSLTFGNYKGTISSFKIWNENGKLVLDCLPAVDGSGKACMYDTVSKKYIYYTGTCQAVVEEEEEEDDIFSEEIIENIPIMSAPPVSENTEEIKNTTMTFRDELKEMILTGDMTKHDISKYGLTYRQVDDTWEDLKKNECYIALNTYGAAFLSTTKDSNGIVQTVYIYNADSDFVERYQRTCAAVNNFLAGVDNKMTDLDKILYAHEYIVKNTTYRNSNNIDGAAGGVLGDKRGRCEGYAHAMMVLLHEMDIDSYFITSSSMNHGWLMVELDGQYYHVDPTWDNTQPGANDIYYHRFLLRNDNEFETIKASRTHYNWYCSAKTGITSVSTRFTNWFVHDVAGCMYYYDGLWYYQDIESNSILCSDVNGNNKIVVVNGSDLTETVKLTGITSGVLKYTVNGKAYTKNL